MCYIIDLERRLSIYTSDIVTSTSTREQGVKHDRKWPEAFDKAWLSRHMMCSYSV